MSSRRSCLIVLAVASAALMFGAAGCHKSAVLDANAQTAQTDNLAPTDATQAASTDEPQQASNPATQQNYQSPARAQQRPQDQNYSSGARSSSYRRLETHRIRTIPTPTTGIQATASRSSRRNSPHRNCRHIHNLNAPAMAICGRPGTGVTPPRATTGCRELGCCLLKWAICGLRDIGELTAVGIATITASGVHTSVTTVALTMGSATAELATKVAIGAGVVSTITAPSTM